MGKHRTRSSSRVNMCFKITVMGSSLFLSSKPPAQIELRITASLHQESRYHQQQMRSEQWTNKLPRNVNGRRSSMNVAIYIPQPRALCSCCFSFFFFCLFCCFFTNTSPAYTYFQNVNNSSSCCEFILWK